MITLKTRVSMHMDSDETGGRGFGRGIELLLMGIDRTGSLNKACKEMHMAYSKGWNVLRTAEAEFGVRLVDRDGAHGSTLTDEGRVFLEHYQEMAAAAAAAAQPIFEKYFAHLGE